MFSNGFLWSQADQLTEEQIAGNSTCVKVLNRYTFFLSCLVMNYPVLFMTNLMINPALYF